MFWLAKNSSSRRTLTKTSSRRMYLPLRVTISSRKRTYCSLTQMDICVKYSPSQRLLHERLCMIVMPELCTNAKFYSVRMMGHQQGISKDLARIQENHTWPGIRRSVGKYVSHFLTCQQVRDKPGDVRFHLTTIQSGHFNDLVQCDHMQNCPSYNGYTGILVLINHFSKFAEAEQPEEYDAIATSRLLLQKFLPPRHSHSHAIRYRSQLDR